MNWRSPKLLRAVHELPCAFDFEHLCVGTVVACHSNQLRDGKGKGIKAHDFRIAAGCHNAHREIDQGTRFTKAERLEHWETAHRRTIEYLFQRGIVAVRGAAARRSPAEEE
jgi:hypothetical protein